MQTFVTILPYVHIGLSVIITALILLQQTGAGLGEAFGGSGGDIGFHTRRGFEKILFRATIVCSVLFLASILTALFTQ